MTNPTTKEMRRKDPMLIPMICPVVYSQLQLALLQHPPLASGSKMALQRSLESTPPAPKTPRSSAWMKQTTLCGRSFFTRSVKVHGAPSLHS